MKKLGVVALLAAVALGWVVVLKQREVARLNASVAALEQQVADAQAEAALAADAQPDAAELERLQQEKAELIRLRGEVAGLRKEKEAWDKKVAADKAAAAAAAERAAQEKALAAANQQQAAQALENVLTAPATVQGAESGNIRRKLLNREQLTPAEQGLLLNLMAKSKEIEKSPQEFASFQTAYVASLLGWNNDPRAAQVQQVLTAASSAAVNRGFDYNAPAVNANSWNEQQQALNKRATGAVQGLLTPEERQVFDQAFIGVLGIDFGIAPGGR